jgi:type II secretory pathway component GspD/PulD (secretin)
MNNVILKIICRTLSRLLPLAILLVSTGCADFFSQKPTEIETRVILNELKQIKENPHIKNKLPELYRQQPQRLNVNEGVKVLYFTRQHPADKLAGLINEQFLRFEKDEKGVEQSKPLYIVTANQATNQLIFQCPSDEEADKVLEFLAKIDVPPIQVNIDCLILERFADVTMDWETTIKIENFLGEKIQLGGKVDDDGDLLPAFPGASLRESKRALFGLDLGYWKNQGVTGHEIRAIVDVLISRGYLRILMNPSLDTVNGQKGKITLRDNVPLEKIIIQPGFDAPFSSTEYQWVEDTLEVTPHVYADGSIGLNTKIQLGSKSKPEGVVQTSIITERTIEIAENRIAPGDSLVIGGMNTRKRRPRWSSS